MSLPQKPKYSGVSPNIAQQSRGPHTIQHRSQNPVPVSREDYRLQHAYPLPRAGVGGAGGPAGAHEMNKQALGSQPPGGLYLAQGPASLGQGPPQQAQQQQHPAAMHAYYQPRQPQQVQQGPPQQPNPQAAPPQVSICGETMQALSQALSQAVQAGQVGGGGGGGGGRGPPGGGGPPSLGRPPPLGQAAQLGLSPLNTPPGAPPQPPAAAYPGALMANFSNQAAGYPAPQHMPQPPILLSNCMNLPYASQRPGQFSPGPQYVYQQYLQPQQAAQVYYGAQGMMSVSLPGGGGPPQVQAPRGQHTYTQGAPPQLQPRQKHVLEIKDPATGRNILDDINNAAEAPTHPPEQPASGASDIAGMFAAQVAAAASSGPPVKSCPSATVLEASLPQPSLEEDSPPPEEEAEEEVEEEEEEVVVVAAMTTPEDRREPPRSSSPPPVLPALADERGADEATQGIPTEAAESLVAPLPAHSEAAVEPAECTGDVESAVVMPEVADLRNSAEARTAVVVEEERAAAPAPPVSKEPVEEAAVAVVPAKTAPPETTTTTREAADSGRESKKSAKKKKMKEWNKKGENKEGGDMDAFVDKEEPSAAQASSVAPEARTPSPPARLSPAPTLAAPTVEEAPAAAEAVPEEAPAAAAAAAAAAATVTLPEQAGEDEQHQQAVKMKNEENLRVSRELAAVAATTTTTAVVVDAMETDVEAIEDSAPVAAEEDEGEEEEVAEEEEERDGEEESSKESGDARLLPGLKYTYREDQWSPLNPEGRKQYDRQFLLMLQGEPMSLKKPCGLPNLDVIKDTAMQHKLPDLPRGGGGPYSQSGGPPSSMGGGPMGRSAHPEHLFMPPYARNGVARPPPGGGGSGGGGGGPGRRQSQPGRGGDKPKKVITLSSSLNQDVKLHAAQNAWKPSHKAPTDAAAEEAASEDLYRRVRGILNKLTPQKFQSLVEQVRNLEINTEERLNRVIDLVFEKALDEPNFSVPYANMCKHLAMFEVPMANDPEGRMVNFRKLLLLKCQKEFEKDTGDDIRKAERLKRIEAVASEEERAKLTDELLDDEKKSKRRSLGNIRFIGELYNLNMLTAPIMFDCLRRLINSNDEDSIECLCKLLITIGKELDSAASKGAQGVKGNTKLQLDEYFRKMDQIVKKREVSLRVIFMLQDVMDLRMRKWVPRRDENIPKTIDQIHEEAQREQVTEELMRESLPRPKRGEDRRKGGGGRAGGGFEDGWNTVPSKKHVDFNKLKQISTKQTEMDTIQLGPGSRMSSWAKGSSGGGKSSSSQEPEGRPSGATNRFSALADAPAYDSRRGAQRSTASSRESSRGRGGGGSQQQSPMPSMGARKTPSQSRERDAALAAVKNLAASAATHEPPEAAREEASSKQPREAAAAPAAAPAADASLLKGPAGMDEDTLRTRTEALVDQFLCNSDLADAVQNVVELACLANVDQLVSQAISHTLDRSPEARRLTGLLLKELLRRKLVPLDLFTRGLHGVLEYGEDMELDIPKVWEYVAELVAPLFLDLLALQYLRDATEPLRAIGRAGRLAACVLLHLAKTLGEPTVLNMWRTAGLEWSHFLKPGEDAEAFAKANGVAFTLGAGAAAPSSGAPLAASSRAAGSSATSLPEIESQLTFLVRTKGAPSATIIEWIESKLGEAQTKKPPFIRALVTAVAENAITMHHDGNGELKEDLIKTYTDLLQKYLNHDEDRELQALYALQALVNRLEHPKGILVQLFNAFYDCDLISEDAFQRWADSKDMAEQEGKGVAIKSTTSFFTWLAETERESGEDN